VPILRASMNFSFMCTYRKHWKFYKSTDNMADLNEKNTFFGPKSMLWTLRSNLWPNFPKLPNQALMWMQRPSALCLNTKTPAKNRPIGKWKKSLPRKMRFTNSQSFLRTDSLFFKKRLVTCGHFEKSLYTI